MQTSPHYPKKHLEIYFYALNLFLMGEVFYQFLVIVKENSFCLKEIHSSLIVSLL